MVDSRNSNYSITEGYKINFDQWGLNNLDIWPICSLDLYFHLSLNCTQNMKLAYYFSKRDKKKTCFFPIIFTVFFKNSFQGRLKEYLNINCFYHLSLGVDLPNGYLTCKFKKKNSTVRTSLDNGTAMKDKITQINKNYYCW